MQKVLSFKTRPLAIDKSFRNTWYWYMTDGSDDINFNVEKIKCFVMFLRKIKL